MISTLIEFSERGNVLSIPDALKSAGFTILVVFAVLCLIFIIISIAGKILSAFGKSAKKASAESSAAESSAAATPAAEEVFSSGSLRLKGCDEKTAAMIMAIVSDNTGIPLSELIFKSITLVEDK